MSSEIALSIHLVIWCAGVFVWLLAVRAHRRAFRLADRADPGLILRREVDVDAPANTVRDKVVEALRTGGLPGVGSVRLEYIGDRRITGELTFLRMQRGGRPRPHRFEIDLSNLGSRTGATVTVRGGPGAGLRVGSMIFAYLLAPAALAAAFILIQTFVIHAADPAVRGQVFQTLQVGHFLWPPFLFAALHRRFARAIGSAFDDVISNTAF